MPFSEARVKIFVGKKSFYSAAEGNGPIHALDMALRNALIKFYPRIKKLNLVDYKVRILTPQDGTKALVRVRIESKNDQLKWSTIGVSHNVIDASYIALNDSITYHLLKIQVIMKKSCMPEIVLVNTQIPENLGATARAMLNF